MANSIYKSSESDDEKVKMLDKLDDKFKNSCLCWQHVPTRRLLKILFKSIA